jgi:hypothetical protein
MNEGAGKSNDYHPSIYHRYKDDFHFSPLSQNA